MVALVLTGCHLDAVGSSLLSVAPDRSVVVSLRCRHDTEACTGTAVVRVDGLDSEAAPYTVAPGSTEAVVVTLTEEQYALVPADLYLPAEVRLDNTGPGAAGTQTAVRGLRRAGPTTRRVSIAADGSEPNEQAYPGALSEDGRYVAFQSKASNLVPGDTNRANDVFVHDGLTGVTSRVSVASDGTQMGAEVGGPAMSADGRHVAFLKIDVFVHDRVTGETTPVSVATDGTQGDSRSYHPAVSADGRYVAFRSLSSNLVPGDTNGQSDVFVHDRLDGTTTRVSVSSSGAQANLEASGSWAGTPSISADGRFVAFESFASNLVPGDTNGTYDVFVHDRFTGVTSACRCRAPAPRAPASRAARR
jgi:archaellum component FlaF (FlaF/FlaG flagellin family)